MALSTRLTVLLGLTGAVFLALPVAGIGALAYYGQEALVFHPLGTVRHTPAELELAYEDLEIETEDGERLAAWYLPADEPRGVILYCHGNFGNIGYRLPAIRGLVGHDLDVLIFDYRGFGESTGRPTEPGLYADADAVWEYLLTERGYAPEEVVVWGRSLGGAVAAYLAGRPDEPQPGAVILESTFKSLEAVGSELYPMVPASSVTMEFDSEARMRRASAPLLIAHSQEDRLIDYHHAQTLYDEAGSEQKRFHELSGGHSRGHLTRPEHRDDVAEFLTAALASQGRLSVSKDK